MSDPVKLTPRQTLDALEPMALEDELDRIAALSDDEVEAALKEKGFDTAKIEADARALHARVHGGGSNGALSAMPRPAGAGERTRRRFPLRAVVVAAAVLIPLGVAAYVARQPILRLFVPSHQVEVPPANPPPEVLGEALRDRAVEACRSKQWDECESLLNQADALDPERAEEGRVRKARWAIEQARHGNPDLPWFDKEPPPGSDKAPPPGARSPAP